MSIAEAVQARVKRQGSDAKSVAEMLCEMAAQKYIQDDI